MLNIPVPTATGIVDSFWETNWALAMLKEDLIKEWESNNKKFIRGLDGRKIFIRSAHSLINAKFQSDGAIIMDTAGAFMAQWMEKYPQYQRVIYYHKYCGFVWRRTS